MFRKQTKIWTTHDGEKVRICDMHDEHLKNAIKMLERKAVEECHKALTAGYNLSGLISGEMAELTLDNEILKLEEEGIDPNEISPLYDNLIEEKVRRNL